MGARSEERCSIHHAPLFDWHCHAMLTTPAMTMRGAPGPARPGCDSHGHGQPALASQWLLLLTTTHCGSGWQP